MPFHLVAKESINIIYDSKIIFDYVHMILCAGILIRSHHIQKKHSGKLGIEF